MLIGVNIKNEYLVKSAFEVVPSLIFDCENCVNLHRFSEYYDLFENVYVLEVELLYKFRKAVKQIPKYQKKLSVKRVVITNFRHLFDHGCIDERVDVLEDAWSNLKKVSRDIEVIIGIQGILQRSIALRYCDKVL